MWKAKSYFRLFEVRVFWQKVKIVICSFSRTSSLFTTQCGHLSMEREEMWRLFSTYILKQRKVARLGLHSTGRLLLLMTKRAEDSSVDVHFT